MGKFVDLFYKSDFCQPHTCPYANLDVGLKIREREKYVGWVRDALKKYNGTKLDRFHIFFDLDSSYKNDIEDWVDFALEHDVKTLILEMVRPFDPSRNNYSFTKRITGESLQVLVLENVDLDGEVFQYISHFRGLEQLSVTGASGLNRIRMFGSSVRLKSLVVRNCWNLEIIEICDLPQLAFFEFEGRPICLDLNSVPNLVKVSLGEDDLEFLKVAFKQLACCLCQLRTLTLDNTLSFLTQENVVFPIPQLPELVCLELRISPDDACVLLQLACFLDASPRLQKLVLKFDFLGSGVNLLKAESHPHNNLKVVEVIGFFDCPAATDIVTFIVDNAAGLESLVIDPVVPWCEHGRGRKPDELIEKERKGRQHAMSLRSMLPGMDGGNSSSD